MKLRNRLRALTAFRVFGEGVQSARGETSRLGRGDHTRNMFGTSLHTTYCKQTIAFETAEIVQQLFDHCELLRRMDHCTNYCDSKQLIAIAATPLAESTPSPKSQAFAEHYDWRLAMLSVSRWALFVTHILRVFPFWGNPRKT